MSNLNGKWNMVVKTYMGDMRTLLEAAVEDGKLSGQCTDVASGAVAPLDDTVLDGNKFSYSITIKTAVGVMTNRLTCELVGDEIHGKSANAMGEFEVIGTRA